MHFFIVISKKRKKRNIKFNIYASSTRTHFNKLEYYRFFLLLLLLLLLLLSKNYFRLYLEILYDYQYIKKKNIDYIIMNDNFHHTPTSTTTNIISSASGLNSIKKNDNTINTTQIQHTNTNTSETNVFESGQGYNEETIHKTILVGDSGNLFVIY